MSVKSILSYLSVAVALSACATITRGTKEVLVVESYPSGAQVEMSNGKLCTTPCSVKIKRKSDLLVFIKKDGYYTETVTVSNKVTTAGNVGMVGSVIAGGLIGGAIDANTGAMLRLDPNPLVVKLTPLRPIPDTEDAAEAPSSLDNR